MFKVRLSSPSDMASVNKLLAVSYPDLMKKSYNFTTLSAAIPLISKARPELLSSGTFYIAELSDGQIVGCGGWTKNSPVHGDTISQNSGHIRHFATHPDFVRQGVGKAIFNRCKEQAQTQELQEFMCYSSLNAEKFYQSLGFSTVRSMDIPLTPEITFPCLFMRYNF